MNKILIVLLCLIGCSKSKSKLFLEVYTPDFIEKRGVLFENPTMEATPIIWENELRYVVFDRHNNRVEIINDHETIVAYQGQLNEDIGLGSAIMVGSKLYIFITKNWTNTTHTHGIFQITSEDLVTFSSPLLVIPASSEGVYFNTSVTRRPGNKFVMAIEQCRPNKVCFNVKFMTSKLTSDLTVWEPVGGIFKENEYTACPTIRYIDGYYYVFYLRLVGHFATYVSRSQDLINWEHSEQVVLSSLGAEGEGSNNSDMDLIELDGQVVINYAIGDQLTWAGVKEAIYDGPMDEFVLEFFQ